MAPGRVNVIGEHADYNDGYVLPFAVERAVYAAAGPRRDCQVVVTSRQRGEERFQLDGLRRTKQLGYAEAAIWSLREQVQLSTTWMQSAKASASSEPISSATRSAPIWRSCMPPGTLNTWHHSYWPTPAHPSGAISKRCSEPR
jgi:hypothetical protein